MSFPSVPEDLPAEPAHRRLDALHWLLLALLSMVALHWLLPVARFVPRDFFWGGAAIAVLGLLLSNVAAERMRRYGTPLEIDLAPTLLVTDGLFARSRNPVYFGMLLLLAGEAVMLGTVGALLPWPVFFLILRLRFIRPEERRLYAAFGERYAAYRRRVRRWM